MSTVDTRQLSRDSLFLLAEVRGDGFDGMRVKVRNLSSGGMMAEGDVKVQRGDRIVVALRNVGDVEGSVAWVQGNRFGIAFAEEIDPKLARAPSTSTDVNSPRFTRTVPTGAADPSKLRKV